MTLYEQIHVQVSGRVQGVGFRFFTSKTAEKLQIVGWVRNLPGGEVEVWAEGEKEKLIEFLSHIAKGPSHASVDSLDILKQTQIAALGFDQFEIR